MNITGTKLKIDQIAVAAPSLMMAEQTMKTMGGNWTRDLVEFRELATGQLGKYRLFFNYDLGVEFEILVWESGPLWLAEYISITNGKSMVPSHLGVHVDNAVRASVDYANYFGVEIAQAVETVSHSNPELKKLGRKYRYSILSTRHLLGSDLKFIERVEKPERFPKKLSALEAGFGR